MRRGVGLWMWALAFAGCEAEPAKIPPDAAASDQGPRLDFAMDVSVDDLGVFDGGLDGGDASGVTDAGVDCVEPIVGEPAFRLVLLHAAGGESALVSDVEAGGVARFTHRMTRLQADALEVEQAGVISVGSGDNFLAGAVFAASLENGVPYFDALALAAARFDVLGLGNHDFDFGPEVLADFIRSTAYAAGEPPPAPDGGVEDAGVDDDAGADAGALPAFSTPVFASANLDVSREPQLAQLAAEGRLVRWTIVETRGVRVGIIGATARSLSESSSPGAVGLLQLAPTVQAGVDALAADGVQHVVLVTHLEGLDEDLSLIGAVRGVDLVVAGGADALLASEDARLLPGDTAVGAYPRLACDADGAPVRLVSLPGRYRYVGRLIVDFDAEGRVVRVDPRSDPVRVIGGNQPDAADPDPWVEENVEAPVRAALAAFADNEVAISEVPLDGRRASLRRGETNLGDLVADALLWEARVFARGTGEPLPDAAFVSAGDIRNNALIPPGSVSELDTFAILPLARFVTVVPDVPREALKEVLENAFSQVEDGADRFLQVAGLDVEWEPNSLAQRIGPDGDVVRAGSRVRRVVLSDGTLIVDAGQVEPGPPVRLATTDFLARGGQQTPLRGAFVSLGVSIQQALRDFMAGALEGAISAERYPVGGSGRIQRAP